MSVDPKAKNEEQENLYKTAALNFANALKYDPEYISRWVGAASLSFSDDPTFKNHPEKEEAMEILKELYAHLLPFLSEVKNISESDQSLG